MLVKSFLRKIPRVNGMKTRKYHAHLEMHKKLVSNYQNTLCDISICDMSRITLKDVKECDKLFNCLTLFLFNAIYHKKAYELLKRIDNNDMIKHTDFDKLTLHCINAYKNGIGFEHPTVYTKLELIIKEHNIEITKADLDAVCLEIDYFKNKDGKESL